MTQTTRYVASRCLNGERDRNVIRSKAVSFGAEALSPQAEDEAEDNGWRKAKYFKLHLHPADLTAKHKLNLHRK